MVKLCAEAINVQLGKRDFSDTEICHLLNELPLMEYSDCFSDVFHMDGRQAIEASAGDVDLKASFARISREQWYTSRPRCFEDKCAWWVLQHLQGVQYSLLEGCKLTPHFSPFFPVVLPPMGYEEEALSEKQMEKRTRDVERYAEQRLIMFKPYRTRDELKAGHETWYAALSSWLDEAASDDQYATAARHERDVYAFRQELLAEAELAGEEVGTPEPSDDEDDEDDENDPLVDGPRC
jgi:hypothetical protein